MQELQIEHKDGTVSQTVSHDKDEVTLQIVIVNGVDGEGMQSQQHKQKQNPIETLALDLVVMLFTELQLGIDFGEAKKDFGKRSGE